MITDIEIMELKKGEVVMGKDGKPIKTGKNKDVMVVKDFSYITVKEPGRSMTTNSGLQQKAFDWIMANAPRTLTNKNIFGSGQETS